VRKLKVGIDTRDMLVELCGPDRKHLSTFFYSTIPICL